MTRFLLADNESDGVDFGHRLFDLMQLDRFISYEDFRKTCLLSVLAHDLGKAGQVFQTMMWQLEHDFQDWKSRRSSDPNATPNFTRYIQRFRHESLSLHLLLSHPDISRWFREQAGGHFNIVCAAAFGHHRKTQASRDLYANGNQKQTEIYLDELTTILGPIVREFFPGQVFPRCPDVTASMKDVGLSCRSFLMKDLPETPVSIAVKWMTILGDVMGSMTGDTPEVSCDEFRGFLEDRLREIFRPVHIDYESYTDFARKKTTRNGLQDEASKVATDILIQGGCGSGKTNAIYLTCSNRPHSRLIFTTPTTGTASQHWLNTGMRKETATRNSRSSLDKRLYGIHLAPTDPTSDDAEQETEDMQRALEVFDTFDKDIIYATADQILGVLGFSHASILWLLYIVQCQVAFDEFHCYDDTMRQNYYQLLRWMPGLRAIPVSATVTNRMKQMFKGIRPNAVHVLDRSPTAPSKRPRYRIHVLSSQSDAQRLFQMGTLWVVNQVGVAQDLGFLNPDAMIYHSRFKYPDRKEIQDSLVKAFNPDLGTITSRAVATQVAEMSLDLSARCLISEIAPIAALIQRLGRLNRVPSNTEVRDAYFYMPENPLPYFKRELETAQAWLKSLEGRDLSQDDLADAFETQFDPTQDYPWEHLMVETDPRNIREDGGWMRRGLLEPDFRHLKEMPRSSFTLRKQELLMREIPFPVSGPVKKMIEDGSLKPDMELGFRYCIPDNLFYYDPRLGLVKNW